MFRTFVNCTRLGLVITSLSASGVCHAVAIDPHTSIRQTLLNMEQAVRQGRADDYLAFIDPNDPVLYKEQQNWAADLAQHTPSRFSLTLVEPEPVHEQPGNGASQSGPLRLGDGWAFGEITMTWAIKPESNDRSVRWPARFVEHEGRWLYAGEDWKRTVGQGVIVLHEPDLQHIADTIVRIFPAIRDHAIEGFELAGVQPPPEPVSSTSPAIASPLPLGLRTQQVKLYTRLKHLQASIYLSYVDPLGGWNEPNEAIKLLVGAWSDDDSIQRVLAHEFGHVATFEMGPQVTHAPWWVLEGIAELAAERFSGDGERVGRRIRHWAKSGELKSWADLSDFRGEAAKHQSQVYGQGHHMMRFISDRFGRTKRNAWLRALGRGLTIDEACRAEFGVSFDDLDQSWRSSIAPTAEASPPPVDDDK